MQTILCYFIFAGIVYWGAWVAQKNSRNIPLAAFFSALFGIFAVIVYYIMGKKNENLDIHKEVKDFERFKSEEDKHEIV